MSRITKYRQNEKATVCSDKNCITVYGNVAKFINAIALLAALAIIFSLFSKAIK